MYKHTSSCLINIYKCLFYTDFFVINAVLIQRRILKPLRLCNFNFNEKSEFDPSNVYLEISNSRCNRIINGLSVGHMIFVGKFPVEFALFYLDMRGFGSRVFDFIVGLHQFNLKHLKIATLSWLRNVMYAFYLHTHILFVWWGTQLT